MSYVETKNRYETRYSAHQDQELTRFIDHRATVSLISLNEGDDTEEYEFLENLRQAVSSQEGQVVDCHADSFRETSFQSRMWSIFESLCAQRPFRIELPIILSHNPRVKSPFINRALIWQKLCDLILEDDDPTRPTIMIFDRVDLMEPKDQHDLARLIRFHKTHQVHRTFVITAKSDNIDDLGIELEELIDQRLD